MGGQAVQVDCTACGDSFQVATEYFEVFGSDPFCEDCLIHTNCNSCKKGLRLEPSDYREIGGEPVHCKDCGVPEQKQTTFWDGLSIGEKIVFPLLILFTAAVAIVGSLYVLRGGSPEPVAKIGVPALGLTLWTYSRGIENS
jgi:hypothetical protein